MENGLQGLRFFVKTFGCQMNENDSEHICGVLAEAGAIKVEEPESGDILIVNTCAVREKSEEKLFSYLGRLSSLKRKRAVLIGVTGCVAQVQKDKLFAKKPFIDFVVGPDHYGDLPSILEKAKKDRCLLTGLTRKWMEIGTSPSRKDGRTSAYVTIMEGCDNFCAYCIVPFSRGREKSRPLPYILGEVRDLAGRGCKEVLLLGQNVNSYKDPDSDATFPALLDQVCAVKGLEWVRFVTSHPRNFDEGIIRAMARNPKVCRELHLPVQSGSTAVLRRMNRRYSRKEYLTLVDSIRASFPEILLSTDVIVGFPGETEREFEATCGLLRKVRFANIFSFRYSPRPMTAASRIADNIPLSVKRRRLIELQDIQKGIQIEINKTFIGRDIRVLCTGTSIKGEGRFAGRSEGYQVVNFTSPRDVTGQFVQVRITGAGPYSLHGRAS